MVPRLIPERFAERTLPHLLVATTRRGPERRFLRFLQPSGTPGAGAGAPREVSFAQFSTGVGRAVAFLRAA
ncbi:MAG: long-chain fatty acid--CoA ligase, partial [Thermoanaerobaculia bacterium]